MLATLRQCCAGETTRNALGVGGGAEEQKAGLGARMTANAAQVGGAGCWAWEPSGCGCRSRAQLGCAGNQPLVQQCFLFCFVLHTPPCCCQHILKLLHGLHPTAQPALPVKWLSDEGDAPGCVGPPAAGRRDCTACQRTNGPDTPKQDRTGWWWIAGWPSQVRSRAHMCAVVQLSLRACWRRQCTSCHDAATGSLSDRRASPECMSVLC